MPLAPETRSRIEELLQEHPVLLFMKGTREAPQCGFSMQVVRVLDQLLPHYDTFDVLSDPQIREGIKEFSDWPTIPQLYVKSEFLGGCDIVKEMYANGELHEALGLPHDPPPAPKITLSDAAAEAFRNAQVRADYSDLRIAIDARYQYALGFGPKEPGDVEVEVGGLRVLLDPDSARRADGLRIDAEQTPQGPRLAIDNPNAPNVGALRPRDVKELFETGEPFYLVDVRPPDEAARASIEGARLLDEALRNELLSLPKDTVLVFHCRSGVRSLAAAKDFAALGYTKVYNLEGGILAWSTEVDPNVPKY